MTNNQYFRYFGNSIFSVYRLKKKKKKIDDIPVHGVPVLGPVSRYYRHTPNHNIIIPSDAFPPRHDRDGFRIGYVIILGGVVVNSVDRIFPSAARARRWVVNDVAGRTRSSRAAPLRRRRRDRSDDSRFRDHVQLQHRGGGPVLSVGRRALRVRRRRRRRPGPAAARYRTGT